MKTEKSVFEYIKTNIKSSKNESKKNITGT